MRPLRLTIQAFTCFKERQGPLDLSELELFAIAGPTGSGKSSLLDAVIFALYGRVPRMRRGYSELISLGRERMSVTLDFRVGRRNFRITRIARRGRSAEAQLEELTETGETSLAGGVQSVDSHVVRLLGLRYEAFTQAVVLPQGDFARFLKSQPRERREILRDLLRLQVYERMRRAAAESSRTLELRLGGIRERLSEDYAEVQPQQVADLERRLKSLRKQQEKRDEELSKLQKTVEVRRERFAKTQELGKQRTRISELARRRRQIEIMENKLKSARKLAPLLPLLDAVADADRRSQEDRHRSVQAVEALREARTRHEENSRRLDDARRRAGKLPELTRKIEALDRVQGILAARESAAGRREQARDRLQDLEQRFGAAEQEVNCARENVDRLAAEVRTLSGRLEKLGYDAERDRALDRAREAASLLAAERKSAREAAAEMGRLEERVSQEKQIVSEKEAAVTKMRESLRTQIRVREAVEAEQQAAERSHAAAHLRSRLEEGAKCPVCDQDVLKLPSAIPLEGLDELVSRVEELRRLEADARTALEREISTETEARAALKESERGVESARKKMGNLQRSVEQRERELMDVRHLVESESGSTLEDRIFSGIKRIAERREAYQQGTRQRDERQAQRLEAQRVLDVAEQTSSGLRQHVQEVRARLQEVEGEIAQLRQEILAVTRDPEPGKERDRLAGLRDELERAVREAKEAESKASAELSSAGKFVEEVERSARESARVALEARKKFVQALREAGFRDEGTVRKGALDAADSDRMEAEVSSYRREEHAVEQRVAELEAELAGEEVSQQDLKHLEEELTLKRRDHELGLNKKAELEQEANELRRRMEKAAELSARQASLEREAAVYRRLATDLRSENFQAYLLEEAFRELVAGASVRLEGLSGRYALEYEQDAFRVLDRENAGERRSADTLSGGETFLASLALALELSEQVQRAAGAVNLDSLFIDEGFGTLDPEALDTVAAAIESLHVGGRMVGIITHIPELTERLPACIRVEKDGEGSRIRQESY